MLDEVLEAISHLAEAADPKPVEHPVRPRETLAVEQLEERMPLSADAAAALAEPVTAAPEPATTDPDPPAATATLSLAPTASPAAPAPTPLHSNESQTETRAPSDTIGELEHELGTQIHDGETPGRCRDGRVASKGPEPLEHADESLEESGDREAAEREEPDPREDEAAEAATAEEMLSAEEKCDAPSSAAAGPPLKSDQVSESDASEQASKSAPMASRSAEAAADLSRENDLANATRLHAGLDHGHPPETPRKTGLGPSELEADLSAEGTSRQEAEKRFGEEPQSMVPAAQGAERLAPVAERLFQGDQPPTAEEMLSDVVKAHDACFTSPASESAVDSPLAAGLRPTDQDSATLSDR